MQWHSHQYLFLCNGTEKSYAQPVLYTPSAYCYLNWISYIERFL